MEWKLLYYIGVIWGIMENEMITTIWDYIRVIHVLVLRLGVKGSWLNSLVW